MGTSLLLMFRARQKIPTTGQADFPLVRMATKKLENYCDALTLKENDRWYAWLLKSMCDISGRPLHTIKLVPADCKIGPTNIKNKLPGRLMNNFMSSVLIFSTINVSQHFSSPIIRSSIHSVCQRSISSQKHGVGRTGW